MSSPWPSQFVEVLNKFVNVLKTESNANAKLSEISDLSKISLIIKICQQ